jgi:hypothetical protein
MNLPTSTLKEILTALEGQQSYDDNAAATLKKILVTVGGTFNGNDNVASLLKKWLEAIGGDAQHSDNGAATLDKILEQYGGGSGSNLGMAEKVQAILAAVTSSPAPSYDADAAAFFVRAGITDETQKNAVNGLVVGLKADALWGMMYGVYPIVGGNGVAHSKNLVADLHNASWDPGIIHSDTSVSGNGTSFGTIPNSITHAMREHGSNLGMSVFLSADTFSGPGYYLGVEGEDSITFEYTTFGIRRDGFISPNRVRAYSSLHSASADFPDFTPLVGMLATNRPNGTLVSLHRNGVSVGTNNSPTLSANIAARSVAIFGLSVEGTNEAGIIAQLSFIALHQGMTDAQAATFYARVLAYQTALGRV